MISEIELVLLPEQVENADLIRQLTAKKLNIKPGRLHVQVLKRSIDARSRHVVYRLKVKAYVDEPAAGSVFFSRLSGC